MDVIDTLGPKFVALLALITVAYFLLTLAPIIWPAFRAFRRKHRLQRPWLFTAVVAALTYGSVYLVVAIVAIPVEAYVLFLAPQLQEMGQPYGKWIVTSSRVIDEWWWTVLPPAVLASTVVLTRKLASKWPGICTALAAPNS